MIFHYGVDMWAARGMMSRQEAASTASPIHTGIETGWPSTRMVQPSAGRGVAVSRLPPRMPPGVGTSVATSMARPVTSGPISRPTAVPAPRGLTVEEVKRFVDDTRKADQDAVAKYIQEAIAAERRVLSDAVNKLSDQQDEFIKGFNALSESVRGIMGAVKDAQGAAELNDRAIKTLASNIEANLAQVDGTLRAQDAAITELARGVTETFTPRRPTKPGSYKPKPIPEKPMVTAAGPEAAPGTPEVEPALQGWGWATAIHGLKTR